MEITYFPFRKMYLNGSRICFAFSINQGQVEAGFLIWMFVVLQKEIRTFFFKMVAAERRRKINFEGEGGV